MVEKVRAVKGASENWMQMGFRHVEAVVSPSNVEQWLRQMLVTEPGSAGTQLVQARHLLQLDREREAQDPLLVLAEEGNGEAAHFLGVMAIRCDDLPLALHWMEQAHALTSVHAEAAEQIHSLLQALYHNALVGVPLSLEWALA